MEFKVSWMTSIEEIFRKVMDHLNENNKFPLLIAMHNFLNDLSSSVPKNNVLNYFKICLVEAMFDVNVMTRDEQ